QVLADVGLEGRRAREHLVAGRRDDLRVDVAVRATHREADGALLGDTHPGFAGAPDSSLTFRHRLSFPAFSALNRRALPAIQRWLIRPKVGFYFRTFIYFFFVSLITTRSSEYRTPLPL